METGRDDLHRAYFLLREVKTRYTSREPPPNPLLGANENRVGRYLLLAKMQSSAKPSS